MLNRNDIYSIIKRILKYFVFLTIIFMFKQCNVYALTAMESDTLHPQYDVQNSFCNSQNYTIDQGNSGTQYCNQYFFGWTWRFNNSNGASLGYFITMKTNNPNPKKYDYVLINAAVSDTSINNLTDFGSNFYHNDAVVKLSTNNGDCQHNGGTSYICPIYGDSIKTVTASWFHIGSNYNNSYVSISSSVQYFNDDTAKMITEQQQTNQNLEDIKEQQEQQQEFMNSTDMTAADNEIDGFLQGGLSNLFKIDDSLQQIVNLPIQLFNSLTSTCTPIQLNIPFINETATIPCPDTIYNKILGSALKNILKIVINGFICYRLLVVILGLVQNMTNPDDSKLEVVDL